ncbi:MAG: MobC family plasmid mobilization relaxosome protein [Clostridiales bacterium]|nr:MobC family plasmid mobilization relaxosome protein [Clostridiales bacterium]
MNGLHPCTLPQQAPFADVRRVSPLCAAFCPACECVRDATGKANVAPTCAKNTKSQSSNAIAILRGGAAKWMSFRARAEAKDMELVPTKEPASHLASRRCPGVLPNAKYRAEAHTHFMRTEENMRKNKQFSIRISAQDLETIRQKAVQAHMSQSDYVISCCLGKKIIILDGLKEVLRQQKAIGNNLNQLTVLANMGKVQFANLDSAEQEFSKINTALRELQEGGVAKSQSSIS